MGKLTAKQLHDLIKTGRDHIKGWRKGARQCYDFVASEQWSEDDKAILEEKGRPPVVFNRTARTVNMVSGLEVQNRQEIRYIPREQTDTGVNDLLTAAAKWSRDNCDAEDEESESFQDLIICGMGWTDTRLDYEEDHDGQIIEDRIDPLEMLWDPNTKKRNLDGAKWAARERRYTPEQFKEEWPNKEPPMDPAEDIFDNDEHNASDAWEYENDQSGHENKKATIRVIQIQYWVKEPFYRVISPNGQEVQLSVKKYEKLKDVIQLSKAIKQTRKRYYQAFLAGEEILEEMDLITQEGFTFRCMTGMRNRNKNLWFGLVSLMIDPQRWANKWLSQIMHILNTNAKGGVLAEVGAFLNTRKAEEDWAKSDTIIELEPGGLNKIKERDPPPMPQALDRLLDQALTSINEIPGVSLELMGLTGRNQAGVLEAQRKQSGLTILAVFFDSLRRFRKEQGRILADLIKNYISDGRLMRIVGEDGTQYIPLLKDQLTFKYDVVLDDTPTSPNQKERVFALLNELVPVFQAAGMPLPPEMLDYLPLPESVIMKIKQRLNQPNPMEQMATQLQLQEQQLKNSETESKTVLNYAKAQKETAIGQDELAQAAQKRDDDLALQLQKLLQDYQLRREKNLMDTELKREKNILDANLKREATTAKVQNG